MPDTDAYPTLVAAGAAELDRLQDLGYIFCIPWWQAIDLDRLDVWHEDNCPLGQLFDDNDLELSGWVYATDHVLDDNHLEFGFGLPDGMDLATEEAAYAQLTEAWKAKILELREERG